MENRGGKRAGSGRKPAATKTVTVSFRIPEKTRDDIRELRECGVDITGEVIRTIEKIKGEQ